MRIKAFAGSLVLLAAVGLLSPAYAAMAPLYETAREIASILQDPGLASALGGGYPIVSVRMTAEDIYEVRTEACVVTVHLVGVPLPKDLVGPRQFTLRFDPAECK